MTTSARRDDHELATGLTRWAATRWPDLADAAVEINRPKSGWSNETLLVTLIGGARRRERLVVRLPPMLPTWPTYELQAQADVLTGLAPAAVPVPRVIACISDEQWLGAPFLVMSHEPGRAGPEMPMLDPWITEAPETAQRALHEAFLAMLAAVHRLDWRALGLDGVVRGGERSTATEVDWWRRYVDWAAEGEPTPGLVAAITWCANTIPASEPPASLCWGDARIGNVLFDDNRAITSVLDWELATIGPAESDLAWYLALDELTTFFVKRTVPGFLERDALIAAYERALGREVRDLEWHEIFALTRSIAINERQARLAAATGVDYPGIAGEQNPALRYVAKKIAAHPA